MTSNSASAHAELEDKVHKLEAKVAERDRLVSSQHGKLRDSDKDKLAEVTETEPTRVLKVNASSLSTHCF